MPSSVAGLIGSCVVIPCSFNYPEHENKVTKFTGIWTERTGHIIYHPVQSKVMQQYRDRTVLLGDLSKKDCSLKIDPIQSSDTGTFHFRIEMEGYEKYSYKQSEVSISLTSVPEAATINVKEDVEQGETVSASCSAFHSCPTNSPVFIWSHSGKMHVQSKGLDNGQWQVTSSLTFHPTRADHSKPLECTVTYQGGQQMNSSKILNVKYAPVNVKVVHKPSVREGDTVQLRCSSDANPATHSYQWHSDSGELLARGQLYTLPNVSRHTGALYCTAINTKGQASSSLVQLNVQYPPEFKTGSTCSSDTAKITCVCIVNSWPPSTVEFFLADRILQSTNVEKHASVTIGTLQGDFGSSELVHCRAHNSQGNATLTLSVPTNIGGALTMTSHLQHPICNTWMHPRL
ncbi:myelin-associated glycoprotein isoform X2 [Myripristis murdjan]|uniref:myelin-associated glycoprotein isoform X2 n=1 Tax=Myripristis murdjan TaxID=586833 RepID=UPI001176469E|nr:myelin-associated glycoprotein-like isoform X2 [Myripristis murdjan]